MGTTPTAAASDLDADAMKDWIVQRARPLSIGAGVIVVAVAGYLFWQQSTRIKNERADAALASAQSAYYAGNTALAKSDLEKVVVRYPGTMGGTQAGMLLAVISYGEGKYDDGIKRLVGLQGGSPSHLAGPIEDLIASGHTDAKRFAEAASHYLKAGDLAEFAADKQIYQAEAARVYGLAGNAAEARKLWVALAADRESPVLNEAKVRLGELDAKVASK